MDRLKKDCPLLTTRPCETLLQDARMFHGCFGIRSTTVLKRMLRSSCNEFSRVIAHPLCTLWSLEKIGLNSCARILPASATLQLQAWIISHVCRLISVTKIRYRLLSTTLNNTSKTLICQVGAALIVEPLRNPRKRTAIQHIRIFSGYNSNVLPHITRRGLRFKRGRHIYAITSDVKNLSTFNMFNIARSQEYITLARL